MNEEDRCLNQFEIDTFKHGGLTYLAVVMRSNRFGTSLVQHHDKEFRERFSREWEDAVRNIIGKEEYEKQRRDRLYADDKLYLKGVCNMVVDNIVEGESGYNGGEALSLKDAFGGS